MTVLQRGLAVPWDVAFAPDGRMFVTERDTDRILVFASADPNAPLVGSSTLPDSKGFEAGPMGLVLHPDFARTGHLYVCMTRRSDDDLPRLAVLRFRVGDREESDRIDLDTTILEGGVGTPTESGCRMRFGPDGFLWIATGQGHDASASADPDSLMGKVLRVDSDGAPAPDNPTLPGATQRTAAYSMGHRNPQGLEFVPGRRDPFVVEHGPDENDEINLIEPGLDYGWPRVSGGDGPGGAADPVWASGDTTLAVSGAALALGEAWGAWEGDLFVATLKEEDLRRFRIAGDGRKLEEKEVLFDGRFGRLRTVTLGHRGALYLTTSNSEYGEAIDRVLRVEPVGDER